MNLFELGPFTLPSGRTTHFKVECDSLTTTDWAALARVAVEMLPSFGSVEGVPRGGLLFADELRSYITPDSQTLLIADDVWVTGLSMERHRANREAIGIVAFARTPTFSWVKSLWTFNYRAEESTYRLVLPCSTQAMKPE